MDVSSEIGGTSRPTDSVQHILVFSILLLCSRDKTNTPRVIEGPNRTLGRTPGWPAGCTCTSFHPPRGRAADPRARSR
eukprot:1699123-Alexandrium_andersonii.AAC.1